MAGDIETLRELEKKILWLASWTIHNANHLRDNTDGLKVGGHQASSASLATIMTALYLDVLPARPCGGEAACLADLPRHPIPARQTDARAAAGVPRLPGRAELSLAHQGRRRRGLLHRLGRPGRGADAVRLASAGLRARAWLGLEPPRGAHGRAGRRRRARRGQYFRSTAGRLETRPAQLLVDHRLQPAESRPGGARGPVGALRAGVQGFRLGRGDREIRLAAAGRVQ